MKNRKRLFLLLASAFVAGACSSSNGDDPTIPPTPTPVTPTDDDYVNVDLDSLRNDSWEIVTPVIVKDTVLEYDLSFTYDPTSYTGDYVSIDFTTIAEAFAMSEAELEQAIVDGSVVFKGVNANGSYYDSYTANNYGHWFNANGDVVSFAEGLIASETENFKFFSIVQNPGMCSKGTTYHIAQALVYTLEGKSYSAIIKFNVTVTKIPGADDYSVEGTLQYDYTLYYFDGYGGPTFYVDKADLCEILGITEKDFDNRAASSINVVPLNADGTEGDHTCSDDYGAWFGINGTTGWGDGSLAYLQGAYPDILTFGSGIHPSVAEAGDALIMRLQYRDSKSLKACNVEVNTTIL